MGLLLLLLIIIIIIIIMMIIILIRMTIMTIMMMMMLRCTESSPGWASTSGARRKSRRPRHLAVPSLSAIYVHIHIYIYIYIYIYMLYTHLSLSLHIYIYIYVWHIHIYIYIYIILHWVWARGLPRVADARATPGRPSVEALCGLRREISLLASPPASPRNQDEAPLPAGNLGCPALWYIYI